MRTSILISQVKQGWLPASLHRSFICNSSITGSTISMLSKKSSFGLKCSGMCTINSPTAVSLCQGGQSSISSIMYEDDSAKKAHQKWIRKRRRLKPSKFSQIKENSVISSSDVRPELEALLRHEYELHRVWSLLAESLNSSVDELQQLIRQSNKDLSKMHPQSITEKVDFLLSLSFTTEQILDNLAVCTRSFEHISTRLEALRQAGLDAQFGGSECLRRVCHQQQFFDKYLQKVERYASFMEAPTDQLTLSEALGVDEATVNFFFPKYILNSFLERRLCGAIKYLKSVGISTDEIFDTPYVLFWSIETLQQAKEKLSSLGLEKPTLRQMHNYVKSRKVVITNRNSTPFVGLGSFKWSGVKADVLQSLRANLQSRLTDTQAPVTQSTIRNNLLLLINHGFSLNEIQSCVLLLLHPTDELSDAVTNLHTRPELELYISRWDASRLLNALQYLLEKQKSQPSDNTLS